MDRTSTLEPLTTPEIVDAGLPDWRRLAQQLHARFRTGSAEVGAALVADAVGAAAAASLDGHLSVRLTADAVDLGVASAGPGGDVRITSDDVTLARALSDVAARHEVAPTPDEVVEVELALDTADHSRLGPFWAAVLTGSADAAVDDAVYDPTRRLPATWFQGTEPHEVPRQRWHLDVWVAPGAAEARIAAAVAAGGTVVDDSEAPSFTVLADPDGNKVCVCTSLDRA
jgi:4a-hydroxytetrahydrobiopterin dehydratase